MADNRTALLSGFKVQGQTAASAAIGTVTVTYWSDGTWTFSDGASPANTIEYSGQNPEINLLLQLMFVGAGGLASGTKLFGYA